MDHLGRKGLISMSTAHSEISSFRCRDGLKVAYRHYAAHPEIARLILVHGLGEHSGRYGQLARRLVAKGLSVWIPDLRGHGESGGQRGHIQAFADYIDDLAELLDQIQTRGSESQKNLVLGHSMGGLITIHFCLACAGRLQGMILSSPLLGMGSDVSPTAIFFSTMLARLWPRLSLGNRLDPKALSHDAGAVAAYLADPLVHDRISPRWFAEIHAAVRLAHQRASELNLPVLIQTAGADRLVDPKATRRFFERLGASDKHLEWYDDAYHEIYNETPERKAAVFSDLEQWIDRRI
jgi:alpha-beta hydrolase superfamily lysophospholipase